ncbi:hypothetical protein HUJ04_000880 [Dendroctonus ponderosae]
MVKLEGTYELVSQENYLEFLKSLGVPDAEAEKQSQLKEPITIKSVSDSSIVMSYSGQEVAFPVGKEYEYSIRNKHTIWTVATISGDTITFKTKLNADGSLTEEKVIKITDSDLTSTTTSSKGTKAVRQYKRV